MRHLSVRSVVVLAVVLASATAIEAQTDAGRFQAGVQIVTVAAGEFDDTDTGVGARVSWQPTPLVGIEAELGLFPGEFADEPAFSRRRLEGLFGITAGPRLGSLRPFVKIRPGFVTFAEAPRPFACIRIFPPPLPCALAAGETVPAIDLGGGLEWLPGRRAFVRFDIGDRVVRYPGPALTSDRTAHQDAFVRHDLRIALGAGARF